MMFPVLLLRLMLVFNNFRLRRDGASVWRFNDRRSNDRFGSHNENYSREWEEDGMMELWKERALCLSMIHTTVE